MALLILPSGETRRIIGKGPQATLTPVQIQELLGGYVEAHRLTNGQWLLVNEEGKLDNLPHNCHASALWAQHGPNTGEWVKDEIVGPAIVASEKEVV